MIRKYSNKRIIDARKLKHGNNNFIIRLTPKGVYPLILINTEKQMFNMINVNMNSIQME